MREGWAAAASAGQDCAVLDWAASGAMMLTGRADGPPVASPAAGLAWLGTVTSELAAVTGATGHQVRADPAELVSGRAALAGFARGGAVSAGRGSFLLRAADRWCAVTLSRPDDLAAVPAVIGALGLGPADMDPADMDPASLDRRPAWTQPPRASWWPARRGRGLSWRGPRGPGRPTTWRRPASYSGYPPPPCPRGRRRPGNPRMA